MGREPKKVPCDFWEPRERYGPDGVASSVVVEPEIVCVVLGSSTVIAVCPETPAAASSSRPPKRRTMLSKNENRTDDRGVVFLC